YPDQGRHFRKRVEKGRARVWHPQHVAFLNLLEAADRGPVEADAIDDGVVIESAGRYREMLPKTGDVGKSEIDHFDLVVLDRLEKTFRTLALLSHFTLPPKGEPSSALATLAAAYMEMPAMASLPHGLGSPSYISEHGPHKKARPFPLKAEIFRGRC